MFFGRIRLLNICLEEIMQELSFRKGRCQWCVHFCFFLNRTFLVCLFLWTSLLRRSKRRFIHFGENLEQISSHQLRSPRMWSPIMRSLRQGLGHPTTRRALTIKAGTISTNSETRTPNNEITPSNNEIRPPRQVPSCQEAWSSFPTTSCQGTLS